MLAPASPVHGPVSASPVAPVCRAMPEVRFLHRIRGEARFETVDQLRDQISRDVAAGQAWWQAWKD